MALIETTRGGRPEYRVRWNYRRDENGKKRWDERSFRSKAEARKAHRELTAAHTATTETITVRQLAAIWFRDHVDTDALQLRTRKGYHTQFDKRIGPALGGVQVAKLTPRRIREWRDWMLAMPTGAPTVNRSIEALKAMVRWGRSEGLCTNTLIDDARKVKQAAPKPPRPYTPAEVARIVAGCEWMREATLIQVAAYAGLRWSELRALEWGDIDLDAGEINLSRALDLDHTAKSTKSDRVRIVPILAPGLEALKAWRLVAPDHALVFPSSTGKPLRENGWYGKRLPKIRAACGIHFDLHELRDTYASILIQTGVDSSELTLWLGHRSIQTTLNRYAALYPSRRASAVAQANERLKAL